MKDYFGQKYYSEEDMARELGVCVRTLRNRRYKGAGHPPYKIFEGNAIYPVEAYQAWFLALPLKREVSAETQLGTSSRQRRKAS